MTGSAKRKRVQPLLRGWWIFTASNTYFCKMTDHQIPPPRLEG